MALKGLKGIQRKKIKKVVVLTEAQKLANNERMAKLREARKLKNGNAPPKHIHPSVVAKPSSDPLNMDNVREWITHCKDLLTTQRNAVRQKIPGALMQVEKLRGYISDMDYYLKNGDWISNYYGKEAQTRIKWRTIAESSGTNEDFFTDNLMIIKEGRGKGNVVRASEIESEDA